jgi:hypothetical protein
MTKGKECQQALEASPLFKQDPCQQRHMSNKKNS